MKHTLKTTQLFRLGLSCVCLTLANCSNAPSHEQRIAALQTKHPNLLLRPAKLSSKLLIADAELQGGKRMRIPLAHAGGKAARTARNLVGLPVAIYATLGSLLFEPQIVWLENSDGPTLHTLTAESACARIKLCGREIRYRPAKAGRGIDLARAVGDARVEVSDRHGSYYCRANEIHYRSATEDIMLFGRVLVSAVHAPGVQEFGLTHINLNRCTLEYDSSQSSSVRACSKLHTSEAGAGSLRRQEGQRRSGVIESISLP
jgi:hypothetical protein